MISICHTDIAVINFADLLIFYLHRPPQRRRLLLHPRPRLPSLPLRSRKTSPPLHRLPRLVARRRSFLLTWQLSRSNRNFSDSSVRKRSGF
jgi:hypothetical protein